MLNVKMPIGLMLLPLTKESLIPALGCTLSVKCIFCRHFPLITVFEAPVSHIVGIFSIMNCNLKICCCFVIYMHLHGFLRMVLHSQKSESPEDRSTSLESVSIVVSSVSSSNFSSISFTVSNCEGFLYVLVLRCHLRTLLI